MEIRPLTIADLEAALLSEDFWRAEPLPITKQKAFSFCRNPRAEKDDTVLLVAYQGNQVVGYLGILPDKIFFDNIEYKLGWLTGWWVDPMLAPKGAGAILLYRALSSYPGVGVSGGSEAARKVLDASQRFIRLQPLKGLEIRLRVNATGLILRKFPALRKFRIGFKIADAVLEEIVEFRRVSWERHTPICQRLTYEYVASIDEETRRFIEGRHPRDLTRRGKPDLEWIMTYPWIVSAPHKDPAGSKYYFSSVSTRFFYLGIKVFERDAGLIGFLLLSVRNDRMTIVYSQFKSRHAPAIAAATVHHALAVDVSTLRLYDELLVRSISQLRCPRWSTRWTSRGFYLSKAFADLPVAGRRLQGGDGDFVFY